jgi:hypothetical protein
MTTIQENEGFDASTLTPTLTSPIPFLGTHNCKVTVVSPKTGEHRTFSIKTIQHGNLKDKRIIALLTGPSNEDDYTGFGFIQDDGTIRVWAKHRGTQFEKFADLFDRPGYWASRGVEYMAEGRCRRCNRLLTHPSSITSGIGPDCAEMEGM